MMPCVRSRIAYPPVSEFDKGRIVEYRNCGLSYHSIAARVGRGPMTVSRIWNRWVQDSNLECRAGSQQTPITNSHVIRMKMDRAVTLQALRQEFGSFTRQLVTAIEHFDDVCCSMDSQVRDNGCGETLVLHHRQEGLQSCDR
ncbi:HTH_Tnp_Tc3_2 domain-containing protein [Trichonephila clavipes]|nr:HTH_Tnp_Tc3_2 domain-containing protein [Trichonephila clavipes]